MSSAGGSSDTDIVTSTNSSTPATTTTVLVLVLAAAAAAAAILSDRLHIAVYIGFAAAPFMAYPWVSKFESDSADMEWCSVCGAAYIFFRLQHVHIFLCNLGDKNRKKTVIHVLCTWVTERIHTLRFFGLWVCNKKVYAGYGKPKVCGIRFLFSASGCQHKHTSDDPPCFGDPRWHGLYC